MALGSGAHEDTGMLLAIPIPATVAHETVPVGLVRLQALHIRVPIIVPAAPVPSQLTCLNYSSHWQVNLPLPQSSAETH